LAAARMVVRVLRVVVIPALAMLTVCCSITCVRRKQHHTAASSQRWPCCGVGKRALDSPIPAQGGLCRSQRDPHTASQLGLVPVCPAGTLAAPHQKE
jgi:hypothetical protein